LQKCRPKDLRVDRSAESRLAKKTGTKEKMSSLRSRSRDRHQNRNKALKAARDKKPVESRTSQDNLKSRYGKPSDSRFAKKAEANSKKFSESKQSRSSSTPRTDSKPKPSGDTKLRGRSGTSRRR
jgi:hypothetical protein